MPYTLPRSVRDRLAPALSGRRNRDACLTLATFLGRFWSSPRRLGLLFMLDRRALALCEALGLTEARVRGAIRALVQVGFLERLPATGRTHQRTPDGLHRKPIAFRFGADYAEAFKQASARAAAARDRRPRVETGKPPTLPQRPSAAFPEARPCSPKYKSVAKPSMHLGENRRTPPPAAPNTRLEAALDRWRRAFESRRATVGVQNGG